MSILVDSFERKFSYLRLSLTDVCNFRCMYCLPDGYQKTCQNSPLDINEIENVVDAFTSLGISKIRLTGGEPTLRRDIVEVVELIAKKNLVNKIALTTNGFRLKNILKDLHSAGLTNLNISIDSLDEKTFSKITGHEKLKDILNSLEQALIQGIPTVKMNTVLMKDINDNEFDDFVNFAKERNISIRFIELMQTGHSIAFFRKHHTDPQIYMNLLRDRGWSAIPKNSPANLTDGPSIDYMHPHYKGRIGFISPYKEGFCDTCNRLRISSRGALQLCLFGQGQIDLRPLLQSKDQQDELKNTIREKLFYKLKTHDLHAGNSGSTYNLSSIGG